jgi:DNA processing protein
MNDANDSHRYWVGFNLVKGIGAARLRALLDYFGDARIAWNAPVEGLRSAGLSEKLVENFLRIRREISLDQFWEQIQSQGISVLTWEDEDYPRLLKEIDQPPPVLYLRGDILPEDEWAVGIVGTRRMTSYGRQVTVEVATTLARNGITVVSGLARGIDSVAHRAAMQAGGRTLAVLGSGVDRIYPPEHRRLAEQIETQGAVISDYPPGTAPEAANFPPRNRIISGLSRVVLVVEAGQSSGALITASFAADQGREVFAVPGTIYAPQSKGVNRLIRDGARPMLDVDEILQTLDVEMVHQHRAARAALPGNAIEAELYDLLGQEPLHVDEIGAQAGLSIEKVTAALTVMELKGLVRQVGAMRYIAVREEQADYST